MLFFVTGLGDESQVAVKEGLFTSTLQVKGALLPPESVTVPVTVWFPTSLREDMLQVLELLFLQPALAVLDTAAVAVTPVHPAPVKLIAGADVYPLPPFVTLTPSTFPPNIADVA